MPGMVARGHGHIVYVASIAGYVGVAHEAVYSATKGGLIAFSESVRYELAGSGVGVTVVVPAAVATMFFTRCGRAYARRFPRPLAATGSRPRSSPASSETPPEVFVPRWTTCRRACAADCRACFAGLRRARCRASPSSPGTANPTGTANSTRSPAPTPRPGSRSSTPKGRVVAVATHGPDATFRVGLSPGVYTVQAHPTAGNPWLRPGEGDRPHRQLRRGGHLRRRPLQESSRASPRSADRPGALCPGQPLRGLKVRFAQGAAVG